MEDGDIDLSEVPEITEEQFSKAIFRIGGLRVSKDKVPVLLDADVVTYFKKRAGKINYQELINETLKSNIHLFEKIIP